MSEILAGLLLTGKAYDHDVTEKAKHCYHDKHRLCAFFPLFLLPPPPPPIFFSSFLFLIKKSSQDIVINKYARFWIDNSCTTMLMQILSYIFLHYTFFSHVCNSTKIFLQLPSSVVETDKLFHLLNLFLDPPSFILIRIFRGYILYQFQLYPLWDKDCIFLSVHALLHCIVASLFSLAPSELLQ